MAKMAANNERSETECLPPLPEGWCWTTLATLTDIQGGITKDQQRRRTSTARDVPYLRVANVHRGHLDLSEIRTIFAEESTIHELRLRTGDILFTEGGDRDKLGRGWVWNDEIDECIFQNHIFRARPRLPDIVPEFISFYANFLGRDWFTKSGKQTTNLASISRSTLRRFPVPVAPLNEQHRIVNAVQELFSDLHNAEMALTRAERNLRHYRGALLRSAVAGNLSRSWRAKNVNVESATSLLQRVLAARRANWEAVQLVRFEAEGRRPPKNWRERYVSPSAPDPRDLPPLPDTWCWASVEQLGDIRVGRQKTPRHRSHGNLTKYVRAANITEEGLDLSDVLEMGFSETERTSYRLMRGDILLSEASGSPSQIGKPAIWNGEIDGCCFQNTVIRLRPTIIPSEYLLLVFKHFYFNNVFASFSAGVGINHLSASRFSRMPIPLPPLPEQAAIVADVDTGFTAIRNGLRNCASGLKRAADLRQLVLEHAFAGRLVKLTPEDEPATSLVQKFQLARDEQESQRRRKSHPRGQHTMTAISRQSLLEVLEEHPDGLSPESLADRAGYSPNDVDEFYRQLRDIMPRILEVRPKGDDVLTWPGATKILLKARRK